MVSGAVLTAVLALWSGQDDSARQSGASARASQPIRRIGAHGFAMFAARALSTRGSRRPLAFCPTALKCRAGASIRKISCRTGDLSSTWVGKKGRIASSGYTRTVVGSRQMFCGASGVRPLVGRSRSCGFYGDGEETGVRRLGRVVAQALQRKGTRLVLHFDLNKTLIMVDPAGGKTQSQVLNSILAEICWGHVDRDGADGTWLLCTRHPPSPQPPSRANPRLGPGGGKALPMLTYSDFLDEMFADGEGKDNRRMKEARDERKGNFSEDGQPGAALRKEYLALERALSMPESVSRSPLAEEAGLAGRDSYYVIPSFFHCLLTLKEAGADFGVVFRTFGSDIQGVSREYNAFCEGKHPLFPWVKMDGSDGHGDYRVHLEHSEHGSPNVGAFYRDDKGVALAMGTLENPQSREQIRLIEGEGRVVYRSMGQIHDAICEVVGPLQRSPIETSVNQAPAPSLAAAAAAAAAANARSSDKGCRDGTVRRRCLALRDYYPFWRQSLEEAAAGKLLPVDLSENPKGDNTIDGQVEMGDALLYILGSGGDSVVAQTRALERFGGCRGCRCYRGVAPKPLGVHAVRYNYDQIMHFLRLTTLCDMVDGAA